VKSPIVFCFDLDGCLLDTVPFFVRITDESLKELGYDNVDKKILFRGLSNPELDKTKRRFIDDLFKWIGREGGIKDKGTLNKFLVSVAMKYLKMTEPQYDVRLFDGVPEFIRFLKKKGFRIAMVTTSSIHDLKKKIGDLYDVFDAFSTRETTRRQKPHPDPIYKALEQINEKEPQPIQPSRAIMIGDDVGDILCGKAAGTKTIGVLSGLTQDKKEFEKHGADLILNDVLEIRDHLDEILEWFK